MSKPTSFISYMRYSVVKIKGACLTLACVILMPTRASPSTRKGFDYASLDPETSQFVQQQTGEIQVLMKRTVQGIFEIGHRLIEVKQRLRHGRFLNWLEAEFDWSWDTAKRFMRVVEVFGQIQHFADLNLAPSALYELAAPSTPEAARSEALARAKAGESISYTAAKAIKQKYATPAPKPKSEPALKSEPEPVSQPQPQSLPELTSAPPQQSRSKLEIVAIRPPGQDPALSEAAKVMLHQTAPAPLAPQPPVSAPNVPGVWWQLGGRHLLYCGDPNSPEFLERVKEKVGLLLAFPPAPHWQSGIQAETSIIAIRYLPQGKDVRLFEDTLESNLLLYSNVGDVVVSCFLPSLEIVSIINRLDRCGLLVEPDSRRVAALISDWKKAGLKALRLS